MPVSVGSVTQGTHTSDLRQPGALGWGGGGAGRLKREGNMRIFMADSCWCMAETNTVL